MSHFRGPYTTPIHEQALAKGWSAPPVGMTALDLRLRGFTVSAHIPDAAVYQTDAESPTGHTWSSEPWEDLAWCLDLDLSRVTPTVRTAAADYLAGCVVRLRDTPYFDPDQLPASEWAGFILELPPAVRAFVYDSLNIDRYVDVANAHALRAAVIDGLARCTETVEARLRLAVAK